MNARWPGANTPLWCTHLHAFSGGLLGVRLPGSQVWEGQPPHLPGASTCPRLEQEPGGRLLKKEWRNV